MRPRWTAASRPRTRWPPPTGRGRGGAGHGARSRWWEHPALRGCGREFDIGIEESEDPLERTLAAGGSDLGPEARGKNEHVDPLSANPLQGLTEAIVGKVEGDAMFRRHLRVSELHRGEPESGHGEMLPLIGTSHAMWFMGFPSVESRRYLPNSCRDRWPPQRTQGTGKGSVADIFVAQEAPDDTSGSI